MNVDELHGILYDIMCEIDYACKEDGVTYFLGGGTMLGAIRHKGFIPWDDDADLCLWYKDYDALKKALKKHLPSHMKLVEPEDFSPYFYDFVPRVIDERYYWHEPPTSEDIAYNNLQNHVCVDIFLVVPGADTWKAEKKMIFQQKVTYGLAMGHRKKIKTQMKHSLFEKLQSFVLSVLGKFFSMNYIFKKRQQLARKYEQNPGKYCLIINDIPKYWDLPYERSWFEGTVEKPFENRTFPVQSGFDEKMTLQYGNYMEPPKDRTEYIQHMKFD